MKQEVTKHTPTLNQWEDCSLADALGCTIKQAQSIKAVLNSHDELVEALKDSLQLVKNNIPSGEYVPVATRDLYYKIKQALTKAGVK